VIRKIMRCLKEYKKDTILTLIFIMGEVILEVIIPFITADMVNGIKAGAELGNILKTGGLMVAAAMFSLLFGTLAGKYAASASAGLAGNVRSEMFRRIQRFSFGNIDKFSTSSLVTRMTTDINNVQNAYMMVIRTAIRSPFMFLFAVIMAFVMGGPLAMTFVVVIPVLASSHFPLSERCSKNTTSSTSQWRRMFAVCVS